MPRYARRTRKVSSEPQKLCYVFRDHMKHLDEIRVERQLQCIHAGIVYHFFGLGSDYRVCAHCGFAEKRVDVYRILPGEIDSLRIVSDGEEALRHRVGAIHPSTRFLPQAHKEARYIESVSKPYLGAPQ